MGLGKCTHFHCGNWTKESIVRACVRACVRPDLVLQAAVFAFCVLPDDKDVNAFVSGLDTWEWLAVHHIGIQIQSGAVEMHDKRQIEKEIEKDQH